MARFDLASLCTHSLRVKPLEVRVDRPILQEREFERVGEKDTIKSNARVIAATNRNLKAMVADRTFREDLYHRLSVFPIVVPPLRARREDIPLLAKMFVAEIAMRIGRDLQPLSAEVMERLTSHQWPGNVRELQNVLERAMILSNRGELGRWGITCRRRATIALPSEFLFGRFACVHYDRRRASVAAVPQKKSATGLSTSVRWRYGEADGAVANS